MTTDRPQAHGRRQRPRYQQIAEVLARRINAGAYTDGRLPTQVELEKEFGVSPVTARAAVKQLIDIGMVERRHGSGSYVVERQLITIHVTLTEDLSRRRRLAGLTGVDSWSSDIIEAGYVPHQVFESLNVAADERVAGILGVDVGAPLVVRRCRRSVDGRPASIETSYFPRWLVAEMPDLALPSDIAEGTTLWMARHGYPDLCHEDDVLARLLTEEESRFFDAPPGLGALVRERITFAGPNDLRALRLMDTTYRSDMHRLRFQVPGDGNVARSPS